MKCINLNSDIRGKKFLIRVDYNVPVVDGRIRDVFRIEKARGTIDYIRDNGGQVLLMSHFEGEGGSLKPVAEYLENFYPIQFIDLYYPNKADITDDYNTVVLFENTRIYPEEKENSKEFAKHCASYADVFVNEAFPASHRSHASIVGIPNYIPKYAGITFVQEVTELTKILSPEKPFVFILGGAKFDTKLPLIQKLYERADYVCIGGALANDFLKSRGMSVGKSLVSRETQGIEQFSTEKIIIPTDVVVERDGVAHTVSTDSIERDDVISDVGPDTMAHIEKVVLSARSILWNGPLGNYEKGYTDSTLKLAQVISRTEAHTVVGGGDTVASIEELGLLQSFTFVSSGGGAMLDFLAHETLPGIEALK